MPESAGRCSISLAKASTPPADAPIPTIGNSSRRRARLLAALFAPLGAPGDAVRSFATLRSEPFFILASCIRAQVSRKEKQCAQYGVRFRRRDRAARVGRGCQWAYPALRVASATF